MPVLIRGPQSAPAPSEYELTGGEAFTPEAVTAVFDGTAAAGPFRPCLSIYAQSGELLSRTFPDTAVAAGGEARVTFAPFLRTAAGVASAGTGVPPASALDDYVFRFTNLDVTGIGFSNGTTLIQGNPVSLDGTTRVKVEAYVPLVEIGNNPPNNQAIGFELYDDTTDKGTIAVVEANTKFGATPLQIGTPIKTEIILTPTAGIHTYAIKVWKNVAGGTCTCFASTFVDGTGNFGPAWYRLTAT